MTDIVKPLVWVNIGVQREQRFSYHHGTKSGGYAVEQGGRSVAARIWYDNNGNRTQISLADCPDVESAMAFCNLHYASGVLAAINLNDIPQSSLQDISDDREYAAKCRAESLAGTLAGFIGRWIEGNHIARRRAMAVLTEIADILAAPVGKSGEPPPDELSDLFYPDLAADKDALK